MLIVGAKRHAKEVLELFHQRNQLDNLCFYDDVSEDLGELIYERFPIITSLEAAHNYFRDYPEFVLAIGNPELRKNLSDKLTSKGGRIISIISKTANIGHYDVQLGNGLNIMNFAMISNSTKIAKGCLINAYASIHHDVVIGEYCEISPHAAILGGCQIGNFVSIGSNATILPNIKIGNYAIIGAGAVVTKDVPINAVVKGVPARVIRYVEK